MRIHSHMIEEAIDDMFALLNDIYIDKAFFNTSIDPDSNDPFICEIRLYPRTGRRKKFNEDKYQTIGTFRLDWAPEAMYFKVYMLLCNYLEPYYTIRNDGNVIVI